MSLQGDGVRALVAVLISLHWLKVLLCQIDHNDNLALNIFVVLEFQIV